MNHNQSNGSPTARATRSPWRPVDTTPGLDNVLDLAFGPAPSRPVAATEERTNAILDELNSMVHVIAYGTDTAIVHGVSVRVGASDIEHDWDSREFLTFMRKQPEYAGEELVCGEPIEFFLHGGQVLVWSVGVYAWELAADTVATFAGSVA